MEVILTNDSLAQAAPTATKTIHKETTGKESKFEFIKGCWFIFKKLLLIG